MKSILRVFFLLLYFTKLSAQTPVPASKLIYLDSSYAETTEENYKYTRLIEKYYSDQNSYIFKEYYKSEVLKSIGTTLSKDNLKKDGQYISYYENGKKESTVNYSNNKKTGREFNWYENGEIKSELEYLNVKKGKEEVTKVKINNFWSTQKEQTVINGNGQVEQTDDYFYERGEVKNGEKHGVWEGKNLKKRYVFTESYNEGILTSGTSTDENNNQFTYKTVLEKPIPAKGMNHFYKFIGTHYRTPKVEGLSGKVYITFVINEDGNPTKLRVLRDIGYDTGPEAVKTIVNYGKWIPGKMRGVPTDVLYSLPITIQATIRK